MGLGYLCTWVQEQGCDFICLCELCSYVHMGLAWIFVRKILTPWFNSSGSGAKPSRLES